MSSYMKIGQIHVCLEVTSILKRISSHFNKKSLINKNDGM